MTTNIVPGNTVHYGRVTLDNLIYDPRIQRQEGIDHKRAKRMADTYNPDALSTIVLSAREDGTLAIIDGAHRCEASRIAGYTKPLHAMIYTGLTLADEARMFNQLNDMKQPSLISRMSALVVAGDPEATNVFGIIRGHGWTIDTDNLPGHFAAVGAAQRIYQSCVGTRPKGTYPEVLSMTIETLTLAWDYDRDAMHNMLVQAVGQIFGRLEGQVEPEALAKSIQRDTPTQIRAYAKALHQSQGGSTVAAAAKVMVGLYNKHRRANNKLPEWVWTR